MKKILVLGASGMLGYKLFMKLSESGMYEVHGTVRSLEGIDQKYYGAAFSKIRQHVDAADFDTIIRALASIQPDVIINCIGLIKQNVLVNDPLTAITINSLLPHRLSMVCCTAKARLIHISTDCVFNGKEGHYTEEAESNATDLYGKSKFLGEVCYPPHCVTLRASIIGHELRNNLGLIEWFLSQKNSVKGYKQAIFSGFTTIEMARIIHDYVIPNHSLYGRYHISSDPISKFELLKIVAAQYSKVIVIEPFDGMVINRSLDSSKFRKFVGYQPPSWPEMIKKMHEDYLTTCQIESKGADHVSR